MATKPTSNELEIPAGARPRPQLRSTLVLSDYWALTKPEVNTLIAVATLAGFCLGYPGALSSFPLWLLINTLAGTLLVASGTATLNQYIERRFDAEMRRTARRPLAAGRLRPEPALRFGIVLSVMGGIYLAVAVNAFASLLASVTLVSYLFIYTPLKRMTPLCTLVGAFPGAMPPLIGWAAATGTLSPQAWILYAMLYLWQFPHFMSIAWIYREDYARAGYLVLPRERKGQFVARFVTLGSVLPLLLLVPLSIAPTLLSRAGLPYTIAALVLSTAFLYYGAQLALHRTNAVAKRLLFASIIYLPLAFALMVIAKF
jgi:protoheme IX farnesyltransferase